MGVVVAVLSVVVAVLGVVVAVLSVVVAVLGVIVRWDLCDFQCHALLASKLS